MLQNNTAPALKQLSVQCGQRASGSTQPNAIHKNPMIGNTVGDGGGASLAQSRGSGRSFPEEVTLELGQVSGREKGEKKYLKQKEQGWGGGRVSEFLICCILP